MSLSTEILVWPLTTDFCLAESNVSTITPVLVGFNTLNNHGLPEMWATSFNNSMNMFDNSTAKLVLFPYFVR